jgi:DedD protein
MAEPADINVDELRRRARRRLVGAVVLALGVAVVVPMLLETEQKPLGEDVAVKIPPIDDGKFVNRLSENRTRNGASAPAKDDAAKVTAAPSPPLSGSPAASPRYDTRLPDAAPGAATSAGPANPAVPDATGGALSGKQSPAASAKPPEDAAKSAATSAPSPPVEITSLPPASTTTTAPSASAAVQKAAPPPPHDGFAVQLAAFADDKGANALAGRLKKSGYAAYTEPLKTSKGTLWRVRVGPYPSREAALTARDKLKTEGQSGIVAPVK